MYGDVWHFHKAFAAKEMHRSEKQIYNLSHFSIYPRELIILSSSLPAHPLSQPYLHWGKLWEKLLNILCIERLSIFEIDWADRILSICKTWAWHLYLNADLINKMSAIYSLYRAALRVGGGEERQTDRETDWQKQRETKYRRKNKSKKKGENWKRISILQIVITAKVIPWNVLSLNNPSFTGLWPYNKDEWINQWLILAL